MTDTLQAVETAVDQSMPMVPLGPYKISRLVVGGNPLGGGSHMSPFVSKPMKRFFTKERIFQLFRDCEKAGINLWQSCGSMSTYKEYREQGGNLLYMDISTGMPSKGSSEPGTTKGITRMVEVGGIAVSHWGAYTDRAWEAGKIDEIPDYLKKARDAGMLVGVSTHIPEVLDYMLTKDWDVDFYMTCLYNLNRGREAVKALLGYVPVPGTGREVYLEDDPYRMFELIQQTSKTCLAFKILAAGRRCMNQDMVEETFKETFSHIKASDAVIVGMYPEWEDQVTLNAGYVKKYSDLSIRS